MGYFAIHTLSLLIASVVATTLLVNAIRDKLEVKIFILAYLVLTLCWVYSGIGVINEHVTCSIKEKS